MTDLVLNVLGPYSTGKIDLFTKATLHMGRTEWADFVAPERGVTPSIPHDIVFQKVYSRIL